jgi:hypothetical protein
MIAWFNGLSTGRKFLVGWSAIIFPFWSAGLIYMVFFSGAFPLDFSLMMLGGVVGAAVVGFFVAWKLAK